jgi:hypothetical protein
MKISASLAVFLTVLLISCDPKDKGEVLPPSVDPDAPTDTSQISKNLLAKTELTSGNDVNTRIYKYDVQNRLIWYSNTSTNKEFVDDTTKIIRDDLGRIQTIIYRSDSAKKFRDPSVDSIIYNVFYDASATIPAYKLLKYTQYGFKFRDSFVYTHDAQSRITKEELYYFNRNVNHYVIYGRTDFGYDGKGDMLSSKTIYYDIDSAHTDYPFEITYTYDDKNDLLNLGNEAIVLQLQHGFSAHNVKTRVGTYPLDPQFNNSVSYTYTFNTKYRPLRAEVTDGQTGIKNTMVYTYQ